MSIEADKQGESLHDRAWTQEQMVLAEGLSEFFSMSSTSVADFMRDFGVRSVTAIAVQHKLRDIKAEVRSIQMPSRQEFDDLLLRVTKERENTLDLEGILKRYPGRFYSSIQWTDEENTLLVALRRCTELSASEILNVLNDKYGTERDVSSETINNRVSMLVKKYKGSIPNEETIEALLGLNVAYIHFLYRSEEQLRQRPFTEQEKVIIAGYYTHLKLSSNSLLRFIREQCDRSALADNKPYVSQLRIRIFAERASKRQGDVTVEEFEAALEAKGLTREEVKRRYTDIDPVKTAVITAIRNGDLSNKIKISARAHDIVKAKYIDEKKTSELVQSTGRSRHVISLTLRKTRAKMQRYLDRTDVVHVPKPPPSRSEQNQYQVEKPKDLKQVDFERYRNQALSRDSAKLWEVIEGRCRLISAERLPMFVRVHNARLLHSEGGRAPRMYRCLSIRVTMVPFVKRDTTREREDKRAIAGLCYVLTQPEALKKLFAWGKAGDGDIEGVQIHIGVIGNNTKKSFSGMFRDTYIHPKSIGSTVRVLEK